MLGVAAILWRIPARYSAFPDAIMADLTTRGIAVRVVDVLHTWPDTVNTLSYGANIRVVLLSGAVYWGRLECRSTTTRCAYRIVSLDPSWIPLADLVAPSDWWQYITDWRVFLTR